MQPLAVGLASLPPVVPARLKLRLLAMFTPHTLRAKAVSLRSSWTHLRPTRTAMAPQLQTVKLKSYAQLARLLPRERLSISWQMQE